MNHMQTFKVMKVVPPQAIVDNASWTATAIDCSGWEYATFIVQLGAMDIAMTALKIQESDDDGSSDAYADVTGLVVGTSDNIDGDASTLPAATDDNKFVVFEVDLRGRNRYLKLVATGGDGAAGTYLSALCLLSRGKEYPRTMAQRGALQLLRV